MCRRKRGAPWDSPLTYANNITCSSPWPILEDPGADGTVKHAQIAVYMQTISTHLCVIHV